MSALGLRIRRAGALCACIFVARTAGAQQTRTDRADGEVYAAILDRFFSGASVGKRPVILRDTVPAMAPSIQPQLRESLLRVEGVEEATVTDFLTTSLAGISLTGIAADSRLGRQVTLVSNADLAFTSDGTRNGWDRFYAQYPQAFSGWVALSRVGYSPSGTQALVMVSHFCGSLCGEGRIVVLRRAGDTWEVVRVQPTWVS